MVDENIDSCQFLHLMACEFRYNIIKQKITKIVNFQSLTKKSKIGEFNYAPK